MAGITTKQAVWSAVVGALAALALTAAPAVTAGGSRVTVQSFDFGPRTVEIGKGGKVRWVNLEGSHTVTFPKAFNETLGSAGDRTSRRFEKGGSYRYFCRFHQTLGMKGTVVVR